MKSEANFWLCLLMASVSGSVVAADPVRDADAEMYPGSISYDAAIPTPAAFLGRPLGAAPVRHHELVAYITSVAEASDRLKLEIAGYTHERRPILFVIATAPQNHARLEHIQADKPRLPLDGAIPISPQRFKISFTSLVHRNVVDADKHA